MKNIEMAIYSQVSLNKCLIDRRIQTGGQVFGKVEDVCRQYGIRYHKKGSWIKFYAPKSRIQIFVEKLHFSLITFTTKTPEIFN